MNVEALQALYVALGGSLTDTHENIAGGAPVSDYVLSADVILAIGEIAASTIELPAVSASDDGDVLAVVNGKWNKAAAAKELPATEAADAGQVLAVNESGEWDKKLPNALTFNHTDALSTSGTSLAITLPSKFNQLVCFVDGTTGSYSGGFEIEINGTSYQFSSNGTTTNKSIVKLTKIDDSHYMLENSYKTATDILISASAINSMVYKSAAITMQSGFKIDSYYA